MKQEILASPDSIITRGDWTEERLLSLSLWGPEEARSLGARIPSCSEPEFSLAWYSYMPEQGTPAKYWLSLQSSHQVTLSRDAVDTLVPKLGGLKGRPTSPPP